MITIKDLARVTGKSVATVSRSLNDSPLISKVVKDKIRSQAALMGYQANLQARSLAGCKTRLVGVVCRQLDREIDVETVKGIDEAARKQGYGVMICLLAAQEAERIQLYRSILNQPLLEGLIAGSYPPEWFSTDVLEKPLIYVDQWPESIPKSRLTVVTSDHRQCVATIFSYFKTHSVTSVLYYGNGNGNVVEKQRFGYIKKSAHGNGLPFNHIPIGVDALERFAQPACDSMGPSDCPGLIIEPPRSIPGQLSRNTTRFLSSCVCVQFDSCRFERTEVWKQSLLVRQNHFRMGELAFNTMYQMLRGAKVPALQKVPVTVEYSQP